MFELKNAYQNVKRNKKRYIIVGILIFIISFISIIALIVNQSAQVTIEEYLNEYGSEATIDIDPEQMVRGEPGEESASSSESNRPDSLTYEEYEEIAQSEYVDSVAYEQTAQITSDDVTALESDMPTGRPGMSEESTTEATNSFTILGSDDLNASSYFEDDVNVITDGEYPSSDNEILISSDLAEENELAVGDSANFIDNDDTTISLNIVGIYENVSQDQMSMQNSQNMVFSNYNTISNFTSEKTNITAKYTLTSYEVVEDFEQELYDNGLDEMYYVNNNQELLDQVLGPVESTMSLLNNLMIAVFIIGGAILIFINLLILRERKYEIGVLRALGQKKVKVISGLLMEAIIVTIISMIIATIVGIFMAQPVSNILMSSNSSVSSPDTMNQGGETTGGGSMGGGSMGGGSMGGRGTGMMSGVADTVTSIQTTMNVKVLVFTFGINLLLILLTTIISSAFITRQQPNEILRER
ncbi:MAG: ABC transporter permease [Mycoplasmatales bacterium]